MPDERHLPPELLADLRREAGYSAHTGTRLMLMRPADVLALLDMAERLPALLRENARLRAENAELRAQRGSFLAACTGGGLEYVRPLDVLQSLLDDYDRRRGICPEEAQVCRRLLARLREACEMARGEG